MNKPLIEVRSLCKTFAHRSSWFPGRKRSVKAVDDISFSILEGETLGLVGESGCGKTTTGRLLVRLSTPTSGKILFKGINIADKNDRQMRPLRRNLQMIFQNSYGSLDPRMTLRQILEEPLRIHQLAPSNWEKRIQELLAFVELKSSFLDRRPSGFSGGQCQRIAIARSLAVDPQFLVADEPVSALDVSIQARILNLMLDLQKELGLTYLFISHDLSVVQYIADRIAVMYGGKIVETADCDTLYESPLHPYTRMLLASIPIVDTDAAPSPMLWEPAETNLLPGFCGCGFYALCGFRMDICRRQSPDLTECGTGHWTACHIYKNSKERKNE